MLSMINGVLKMKNSKTKKYFKIFLPIILVIFVLNMEGIMFNKKEISSLRSLLSEFGSWKFSEAHQNYVPGTLFEYINGAAESYLAYNFVELIVGQYKIEGSEPTLSVEIYDMGNGKNSFGIYSIERFPDSQFISLGNQGYMEEGTLNFIVGKYYIKLLCYDCGEESEKLLKLFSQEVVKRVKDKGQLPPLLRIFPGKGLIQNSEKFFLRNFMGYSFFHDGYLANYKLEGLEFDCFFIEGENAENAQEMLMQYLEKKGKQSVQKISTGYRIKDRYYRNIYLARIKNYLCGVRKIKNEYEELGERFLGVLIESLKK